VKVSPFIVENHELAGVLLIPLIPGNSVDCEDFKHKFSTGTGVKPSGETIWNGYT
jgi:hypothetical protein